MALFLGVFVFTIIFQLSLTNFQSQYVMNPISERTGNIQSISQFIHYVSKSMDELNNFRWEYGDSIVLITNLNSYHLQALNYLKQINSELKQIGKEQYLLYNAIANTSKVFSTSLNNLIDNLELGNIKEASAIFYNEISLYGEYLLKYSQELLQQAILDNQATYVDLIELNNNLKSVQAITFTLCVISGFLVITSIIRLLKFIQMMSLASQEISKGNFTGADIEDSRNDEIGYMAKAFNEMKHSMNDKVILLEEKNAMEKELFVKENEALGLQNLLEREKLQQLRSQINPHFLFNTLNVIKLTSHEEQAIKTEELLTSLSKLYRYILASNDKDVYLSREVQIVNEFYALYKARFADKMKLVWNISSQLDLTETLVPSFLLQPLVENAFKHGLGPKEANGTITVRLSIEEEMLKAVIEDDGVGMSEERLENLRLNLVNPPTTGTHIGLYNIAARLKLRDKRCTFDIESKQGIGTKISLTLPYVTTIDTLEEEE